MAAARHLAVLEAERADRDRGEADRAQRRGFGGPFAVAEPGIAGEEDIAVRERDDEARPQRTIAIGEPAAVPMVAARDVDGDIGAQCELPAPIERARRHAGMAEDAVIAEARDDHWPVPAPEPFQRRQIHMVVMVMADQDEVDLRQVFEADAGRGDAARAEAERAGAVAPHRIGEDVHAVGLDQHAGMADPGDSHRRAFDAGGGSGRAHRDMLGPGGLVGVAEDPLRDEAGAAGAGDEAIVVAVGIEEMRAVEMRRDGAAIIDAVEEVRQHGEREAGRDGRPEQHGEEELEQAHRLLSRAARVRSSLIGGGRLP